MARQQSRSRGEGVLVARRRARTAWSGSAGPVVASAVESAERAGLLDAGPTEHLSVRLPQALVQAARERTGVQSPTELSVAAFAMLAQRDAAAEFMLANLGRLGPDFDLES